MKIAVYLIIFLSTLLAQSKETSSFVYTNIQAMGGYPLTGFGFQIQKNIHALDVNVAACVLNPPSSLKIYHTKALYLMYPLNKGIYFGAGLGLLNDPESMAAPTQTVEGTFGYNSHKHFFIEMNVMALTHLYYKDALSILPGLTLGFRF